jgi:uncharacterized membrane protein YjgN (DUF898 family)
MFSFSTHISQAYVTTGLTNVLYIRSLEFLINSLLLNRSWFAENALFPREISELKLQVQFFYEKFILTHSLIH